MSARRLLPALPALLALALCVGPAQAREQMFRTADGSVFCATDHHRFNDQFSMSCTSHVLLRKWPASGADCERAAATIWETGRVGFTGICDPYGRVRTLRPGDWITRGPLNCAAERRWRIRCWSTRSGHGFRLAPRRLERW